MDKFDTVGTTSFFLYIIHSNFRSNFFVYSTKGGTHPKSVVVPHVLSNTLCLYTNNELSDNKYESKYSFSRGSIFALSRATLCLPKPKVARREDRFHDQLWARNQSRVFSGPSKVGIWTGAAEVALLEQESFFSTKSAI